MKAPNQPRLEAILKELEQASELDQLQVATEALRDHFKIDHIVYHWVDSAGEQYGCGSYSDEWRERYIEKGYIRVDPVILGCYQRFHPVDWKRLDWSTKAAKVFQSEAIKYGVGNQGFSVPIRGPNGQFALFTVSHSGTDEFWAEFTETHRRNLILIAHYFNQKALEFEPERKQEQAQALSPREIDAMTYLAKETLNNMAFGMRKLSIAARVHGTSRFAAAFATVLPRSPDFRQIPPS
ncbi:MAG: autoinducer binding domain-containing protein, partial [Rhodobacterales bacterium]|nr:autoinducer binding domain-containing protein [Rhodobacterales bacterium]